MVPAARLSGTLIMIMLVGTMLSGCGYTMRAPFDTSVKTVFVPVFNTQSFRRDLKLKLTEMVQKEISSGALQGRGTPEEPTRSSKARSTSPTRTWWSRTRSTCPAS